MKRARSAQQKRLHATTVSNAAAGAATISVPVLPPRNPYSTLARQRKGGVHDADPRKRRRLEKNELRRKLDEA